MSLKQNKVTPQGAQDELFEGGKPTVSKYMSAEMIDQSRDMCFRAHNPIKLTWNNLNFKVKIEKLEGGKKETVEQ